MDIEEYKKLSEKTLSKNFHIDNKNTQDIFVKTVESIITKTNQLDQLKKVIYYGKDIDIESDSDITKSFECINEQKQTILHAAIGMVTESVEILDQVFNSIKDGKDIDIVNIEEELGDVDWYKAIFLREYDLNEGDLRHKNIDKLATRFGDKFSEHKALNRDLKKEREILEKK